MNVIFIALLSFCAMAQDVEVKVLNTSAPTTEKEKRNMEKKLSQKVNTKKPEKKK